jgi:hypothetical protein
VGFKAALDDAQTKDRLKVAGNGDAEMPHSRRVAKQMMG